MRFTLYSSFIYLLKASNYITQKRSLMHYNYSTFREAIKRIKNYYRRAILMQLNMIIN